jgi:S-adenosylmethionine uptake transporter
LISVLFYALTVIVTRKLQTNDSSGTMAYYSSLVYLVAALVLAPLPIIVGEMPNAHPSIVFLIRAWSVPTLFDWVIMSGLGLVWAGWMYFMSRAYSLAQASVIAPFEYLSLPINIMWGFVIWHEIPTWMTLAGAFLTLFSGIYVLYREQRERPGWNSSTARLPTGGNRSATSNTTANKKLLMDKKLVQ